MFQKMLHFVHVLKSRILVHMENKEMDKTIYFDVIPEEKVHFGLGFVRHVLIYKAGDLYAINKLQKRGFNPEQYLGSSIRNGYGRAYLFSKVFTHKFFGFVNFDKYLVEAAKKAVETGKISWD